MEYSTIRVPAKFKPQTLTLAARFAEKKYIPDRCISAFLEIIEPLVTLFLLFTVSISRCLSRTLEPFARHSHTTSKCFSICTASCDKGKTICVDDRLSFMVFWFLFLFFLVRIRTLQSKILRRHARHLVEGVKNCKKHDNDEHRGFLGWSRPNSGCARRSQGTLYRRWIEEYNVGWRSCFPELSPRGRG